MSEDFILESKRATLIIPYSQCTDSIYQHLISFLEEKMTLIGVLIWTDSGLVVDNRVRMSIFKPFELLILSEFLIFAPILENKKSSLHLFDNSGYFPNILTYLSSHNVSPNKYYPLICIYLSKDFGSKDRPHFWKITDIYNNDVWKVCSFKLKFTHNAYYLFIDKIYDENLEQNLKEAIISKIIDKTT